MANPTFNSVDLTSHSPNVWWGSPIPRHQLVTVPSVSGAFIANYGVGHREIFGVGYLSATGASGDAAQKALKAALRTVQAQVNLIVGAFVDTDAVSHTGCLLVQYQPVGRIQIEVGSTYTARLAVRFVVVEQDPD